MNCKITIYKTVASKLIIAAGLLLTPIALPISSAMADCLYECEGPLCADFGNHTDLCMTTRAKCEASCSNKRAYGAIAYSKTEGGFGWSDGWDYQDQAEKVAVENCDKNGTACEAIVWFYNNCGAVAADDDDKSIITWGRDSAKQNAEATALSECKKANGKNCKLIVSKCSR